MAKVLRSYNISERGKFKFPLSGWGKNGFTVVGVHLNLNFIPQPMIEVSRNPITGFLQTKRGALKVPFSIELNLNSLWSSQGIAEQFVTSDPALASEKE